MKILFFSDIHGVADNLSVIDEEIEKNKIDNLVCLGDLYYSYSQKYDVNVESVKKFLMKYKDKLICMRGNCDLDEDINFNDFSINHDLLSVRVDGLDLYLTHGNCYSYKLKDNFKYKGILIYGHEHIPYIKKENDIIYICVGSISLPRSGIATYCIYENRCFTIYDIYGNIVDRISL